MKIISLADSSIALQFTIKRFCDRHLRQQLRDTVVGFITTAAACAIAEVIHYADDCNLARDAVILFEYVLKKELAELNAPRDC